MKHFRIGIVAGEASGDILGAELMAVLKRLHPAITFEGILGDRMLAQGGHSYYSMARLSVMGFIDPLKRLPELITMRKKLYHDFLEHSINLFIGIDAPDFNLELEGRLKAAGVKTVHYVSPSVWAWRKRRIHKIARSVDMMLTLFPFENAIYQEYSVPHCFVGHPLADVISRVRHQDEARRALGLTFGSRFVALLAGSRWSELQHLGQVFFEAVLLCYNACPDVHCLVPVIDKSQQAFLENIVKKVAPTLPVTFYVGEARRVLMASDIALVASGTATLEAMLTKCPMVVAYRMHGLMYAIVKRLVNTPWIALPNILAGRALVPEFIQHDVTASALSHALLSLLQHPDRLSECLIEFDRLHGLLQCSASERAAEVILTLLNSNSGIKT